LNATIPGIFAKETKDRGLQFTHISTDAVFDGIKGNYIEEDPTNPLSVYAQTKFKGEQAVLEANPDSMIARVNFYGWSLSGKRSLAEFFYNNLSDRKLSKGFKDVYFCPLQVNKLSELLLEIFDKNLAGIYHVVSSESLNKFDFGQRLARKFGFEENLIKPISVNESDLQAKRSQNLNLRSDKRRKTLGHSLPNIQVGLDLLFDQHQNGYREKIQKLLVENSGE
jgi:dTDP-4-dehydrorhamnose reductase